MAYIREDQKKIDREKGILTDDALDALRKIEGRATEGVTDIDQLVDRDIALITQDLEKGINADGEQVIAQLKLVQEDSESLLQTFMNRLRNITERAVQLWNEYQEKRLTDQLVIPDNPKIITRLLKQIANSRVPVEQCLDVFNRADKQEESLWSEVRRLLDLRIVKTVLEYLKQDQVDQAMLLWDELSDEGDTLSNASEVVKALNEPMSAIDESAHFSYAVFVERMQRLEQFEDEISTKIGGRHQLERAFSRQREHYRKIFFTDTGKFLMQQTRAAVDVLAVFPPDQQQDIVTSWFWDRNQRIDWAEALTDSEVIVIVSIMLEYPGVNSFKVKSDRDTLLKIGHDFSAPERKVAWQKCGEPEDCNWDEIYTYLAIGRLPISTSEQIASLDRRRLKYVTLFAFAHGEERLAEFWTEDGIKDLVELTDGQLRWGNNRPTPELLRIAKNITPAERRHLPLDFGFGSGLKSASRPDHTIWDNRGFQVVPELLENFSDALQSIPFDYRDAVLDVLSPSGFLDRRSERKQLTSEQAKNFMEYTQLLNSANTITLNDLIGLRDFFINERWQGIKAGIKVSRVQSLHIPAVDKNTNISILLNVYEKVGLVENANINQFIIEIQKRGESYIRHKYQGASEFEAVSRTGQDIHHIYNFERACQEYFSANPELVMEFLGFNEEERKIVELWISGKLVTIAISAADIGIIEGIIIRIGKSFAEMFYDNKTHLDRFQQLSAEEKKRWLFLEKNIILLNGRGSPENVDTLFELATNDEGKNVIDFIKETGLLMYEQKSIRTMAKRPECAGLFYYLRKQALRADQENQAVETLIALHDAGLPAHFHLSGYTEDIDITSSSRYGPMALDLLAKWNYTALVECANIAMRVHPELTLVQLLELEPNRPIDEQSRIIEMARLKKCDRLWRHEDVPIQTELDQLSERIQTTESILNIECSEDNRSRLQDLSKPLWERFKTRPAILSLFLNSKRGYLNETVLGMSDEMLMNTDIWKFDIPTVMWTNEETLQSYLDLVAYYREHDSSLLNDSGNFSSKGDELWRSIITTFREQPWLFTTENYPIIKSLDLGILTSLTTLTESEWREFIPTFVQYKFNWNNEVNECILAWREGFTLLQDNELEQLQQYVRTIPWKVAVKIASELQTGTDIDQLVSTRDASDNYNMRDWQSERRLRIRDEVKDVLPTFGAEAMIPIEQWQRIVKLPHATLRGLEQLSEYSSYEKIEIYSDKALEIFIVLAEHSNLKIVLDIFQEKDGSSYEIFQGTPDMVERFCNQLTPEIVEKLRAWPNNLHINTFDTPIFFTDSRVEEVLIFARELRNIFGDKFVMTVYDLLIMDIDFDLINLQEIRRNSIFPITPGHLKKMAVATADDVQASINRTLAIFDHYYKIDYGIASDQIKKLSPELRTAVIAKKGPGNFGWSIMEHRQELVEHMSYTLDQIRNLILELYRANSDGISHVDIEVAQALLGEPNLAISDLGKRFQDVSKNFKGDNKVLADLIFEKPEQIAEIANHDWGTIPSFLKEEEKFWLAIREYQPLLFFYQYPNRVDTVGITDAVIDAVANDGHVERIDEMLVLEKKGEVLLSEEQRNKMVLRYIEQSSDLDAWFENSDKKVLIQDRFTAIVQGWSEDPDKQTKIMKKLARAGMISTIEIRSPVQLSPEAEMKLIATMMRWQSSGLSNLDSELDTIIGARILQLGADNKNLLVNMSREIAKQEFANLDVSELSVDSIKLTEENWLPLVMTFIRTTIEDYNIPKVSAEQAEFVKELFKSSEAKDFCMSQLQRLWKEYLNADPQENLPISLMILSEFINDCEGAGPMSQFEALGLFIHATKEALSKRSTVKRTKVELTQGLVGMDSRFTRERWSNDDTADFYNISRDVEQAAPSLFTEFLEVFQELSPSEFQRFQKDIYPFYRAQLAVLGELSSSSGDIKFKARELVEVRRSLQGFSDGKKDKADFESLRKDLIGELAKRFEQRFGIIQIPEEFTPEHVRSLTNMMLYLANLRGRNEVNEQTLGWYLALMINNKWDAFRRGEEIEPGSLLTEVRAQKISEVLKRRQELSPLKAERLNILEDDVPEFQSILQREASQIAVGDVETIDVKLGNVLSNLRTLIDPDLYPDEIDKQRIQLLVEYGNKTVGRVAAKMFQWIANQDRKISFSDEEGVIKEQIEKIISAQGLTLSTETIKKYFQAGIKSLSLVVAGARFIEDVGAEEDIELLRKKMQPSDEVVAIFNRLGEGFKPTSGAMALTQDLDYLDNIIVKREDEITPEEKELIEEYIADIRSQVIKLQTTFDKIKAKFATINRANAGTSNTLLLEKLSKIEQIINARATQQVVTSTLTHDMNPIIENIRECLSCKTSGCNNDTDLTFGDSNKFFIYSNTETQRKGSIADEIVFLEPVKRTDGSEEMAFVFDRVYGSCTPFILTNHIKAVMKSYQEIKKRFPDCKLSLFVTNAAMGTGGLSADMLGARLKQDFGEDLMLETETLEVDIVESAVSDHYVEFGGGARSSGARSVSGLVIRL
ncbi:MAG: hypothetical protein Q8P90_01235 [bacterium]|nr:hypothetical protein [bacterium]